MRHCRFLSSSSRISEYSHAVIGGGAVGLSIAAQLAKQNNKVLLIEKNTQLGQETSSRNSEVIHAGLYYPENSLKTKLCIEGKELLYSEAHKAGVEMMKCGKWIVAQTDKEDAYIELLHYKAKNLGIKTELISTMKCQYIEPAVEVKRGVLSSPTTGILSAHSLMLYYRTLFESNEGEVALGSKVTGLEKDGDGYRVSVDSIDGEHVDIKVDNVINSAGLYADRISNMLLPEDRHVKYWYAKGTYYNLNSSFPEVRRLIYPVPGKNLQGLGTHLTLGLDGQIKFGPDVEYVDSPTDLKPSDKNKAAAYEEILKYLPHVMLSDLETSYSGIRPKLFDPDSTEFQDFVIREEEGFPGFVNLLGIESPGLTASMAIGKYVANMYR
jgi:L-2-hydroxyglutarate oxidase LhgO